MACCLLAAIVIARWLTLWERTRSWIARSRAWLLRQPLPAQQGAAAGPAARGPLRLGARMKAFIALELALLALLAAHETGALHLGPHTEHAALQEAARICTAAVETDSSLAVISTKFTQ